MVNVQISMCTCSFQIIYPRQSVIKTTIYCFDVFIVQVVHCQAKYIDSISLQFSDISILIITITVIILQGRVNTVPAVIGISIVIISRHFFQSVQLIIAEYFTHCFGCHSRDRSNQTPNIPVVQTSCLRIHSTSCTIQFKLISTYRRVVTVEVAQCVGCYISCEQGMCRRIGSQVPGCSVFPHVSVSL